MATADGHELAGDLLAPVDPIAGVVLCHPHPQLGGSRHDRVVTALFQALGGVGATVLRFDFRREFGGGIAERRDAEAAVDLVAGRVGERPVHLVGYSFGALVALTAEVDVTSRVAIAPPLPMAPDPVVAPSEPTLLLVPEHDPFCPPVEAERATAGWPRHVRTHVVAGADHLVTDGLGGAVAAVTAWARDQPAR